MQKDQTVTKRSFVDCTRTGSLLQWFLWLTLDLSDASWIHADDLSVALLGGHLGRIELMNFRHNGCLNGSDLQYFCDEHVYIKSAFTAMLVAISGEMHNKQSLHLTNRGSLVWDLFLC